MSRYSICVSFRRCPFFSSVRLRVLSRKGPLLISVLALSFSLQASHLYPKPHTVAMYRGLVASSSTLTRRRRMFTSTIFTSPK